LHSKSLLSVGILNGKIVYVSDVKNENMDSKVTVDGQGLLLLPGLVETHIHLDKAFLLDRLHQEASSLQEAIRLTREMKFSYTYRDMEDRALRVIRRAVGAGVTHMRCHVEVDPILKLDALNMTLALRERLRDVISLQLVVFPQEGILCQPGTKDLMEEALRLGADIVGGIPYNDPDPSEHLRFVFDLAEKYGKPLDLHADFSDDPEQLSILEIVDQSMARGMQGQVTVGHMTSLGSVPVQRAQIIAASIAKADINVICLPATDLYLNGRGDTEQVRRGLAPVKLLLEEGVNVVFGSNNIRNAFTPFGSGDPLDIALLLAQTVQMGTEEEARVLCEMATYRAARALQIPDYGIYEGANADLMLVQAHTARDLLLDRPVRIGVWKKGMKIAETSSSTLLLWEGGGIVEEKGKSEILM
jgi:cytosine deaminase